jgi:hypothetical protein
MKTAIAICISFAVIKPCLGDETVFTCAGASDVHSYSAEGVFNNACSAGGSGLNKLGWSTCEISNRVTKLIKKKQPDNGSGYDIQIAGRSALRDSCAVRQLVDMAAVLNLDTKAVNENPDSSSTFIVTCIDKVSSYVFITRRGAGQLIETHSVIHRDATFGVLGVVRGSVIVTKDCRNGD